VRLTPGTGRAGTRTVERGARRVAVARRTLTAVLAVAGVLGGGGAAAGVTAVAPVSAASAVPAAAPAATGATAPAATGATASAAAGATPLLLLSDDGDVWRRSLPTALLGDDLVLVPGAVSSARFWVANTSTVPAVLGASVALDEGADAHAGTAGDGSAGELSRWVRLTVVPGTTGARDAAAGGTTAGRTADAGRASGCPTGTGPVVAAGGHVPLDVTVALDGDAPVEAAGQALAATVVVTLRGLATDDGGAGCAPTGVGDRVLVPVVGSGASGTAPGATDGSGRAGGTGDDGATGGDRSAAAGGGAGRDLTGPSSVRPAGDGEPVPFVPVPLRGSWLPVTLAALAALGGGVLAAAGRRRARGRHDRGAARPGAAP